MFNFLLIAANLFTQFSLPYHPCLKNGQPSDWVEYVAYEVHEKHPSQTGTQYLLFDKQVNVESKEIYHHVVKKVLEGGLEECAKEVIEFDPSYQSLMIHQVAVFREGKRVDTPFSKEARLLQNEENLYNQIYTGKLNLFIHIQDLRKDDVVEIAYTTKGMNPAFKEHWVDALALAYPFQIDWVQYRCLRTKNRPLSIKIHNSDLVAHEILHAEDVIETKIEQKPSELIREFDSPSWYFGIPLIQVSSFQTWEEVSEWGSSMYLHDSTAEDKEVMQLLSSWSDSITNKQDLVIKAVDFVQNEIHYFGTEDGVFSFQPYSIKEILKRRYGDCKDKTFLLKSFMDVLGIPATPCLVHTKWLQTVDDFHPSPAVFNHALLKIELDGKEYFLDPTYQHQGGDLEARSQDYFRSYLPLDGSSIQKVPSNNLDHYLEITNHFSLNTNHPQVLITRKAHGDFANHYRRLLAYKGKEKFEELLCESFSLNHCEAEFSEPIIIRDDVKSNIVEVSYTLNLLDPIIVGSSSSESAYFDFYADTIIENLPVKGTNSRTSPLEISHPVKVKEKHLFDTNSSVYVPAKLEEIIHPSFNFSYEIAKNGDLAEFTYIYESKQDHILPTEMRELRTKLKKIEQYCSRRFYLGSGSQEGFKPSDSGIYSNIFIWVFLLVTLVITLWNMFKAIKKEDLDTKIQKKWKVAYWIWFIPVNLFFVIFGTIIVNKGEMFENIVMLVMVGVAWGFTLLLFKRAIRKKGVVLLGLFCVLILLGFYCPLNIYLLVRSVQLFRHNRARRNLSHCFS